MRPVAIKIEAPIFKQSNPKLEMSGITAMCNFSKIFSLKNAFLGFSDLLDLNLTPDFRFDVYQDMSYLYQGNVKFFQICLTFFEM